MENAQFMAISFVKDAEKFSDVKLKLEKSLKMAYNMRRSVTIII